jgi:uncharacterized protein
VTVFFDTSALAKRYIHETGSEHVEQLCQKADAIVVSAICLPEMISALARMKRKKEISLRDYSRVKQNVMRDFDDLNICDLSAEVIAKAILLLERHTLRAMDALHVGCALIVKPDLFVSADTKQMTAAEKSRLQIQQV